MKKTILIFGLISGVISSTLMLATIPFMDKLGHGNAAYVFGYTAIVLSFLLVYFGIRSFRDNYSHGEITFGRAFAIGLAITLISCVFYVITWEIAYFNFLPHFMDNYGAAAIDRLRASGASPEKIAAQVQQLNQMKQMYSNPLYNAALTFIEPFPVGLVITLISAAILRRKHQPHAAAHPLPTA